MPRVGAFLIWAYCPQRVLGESHNLCPRVCLLPALCGVQPELRVQKSLMRCLWSLLPNILCSQSSLESRHMFETSQGQVSVTGKSLRLQTQSQSNRTFIHITGNIFSLVFLHLNHSTLTNSLNLSTGITNLLIILSTQNLSKERQGFFASFYSAFHPNHIPQPVLTSQPEGW